MSEKILHFLLETTSLTAIVEEYSRMAPLETGGILMGYATDNTFVITDIVGPGPRALHTNHTFTPDNAYHEAEMARIYMESGRHHTYLGDWHTHPGSAAYLSERDKKTLRNISAFSPSRLPEPLMLILGSIPFELKCWIHRPRFLRPFQSVKITLPR